MTRLCVTVAALVLTASPALAQQALSAASPDGKRTATATDKKITLTDNGTQRVIFTVLSHKADVTGLAFSPDGKMIGSVDKDGKLNLVDGATGRLVQTLQAQKGGGTLTFSGDGKTVEVKAPNSTKKFDLATGKEQ